MIEDEDDEALKEAELLVLDAQLVVDRQRKVVMDLLAKSQDASEAKRLLLRFTEVLTLHEQTRDLLKASASQRHG